MQSEVAEALQSAYRIISRCRVGRFILLGLAIPFSYSSAHAQAPVYKIKFLSTGSGQATSINDAGVVAGYVGTGDGFSAVTWSLSGTETRIPDLPSPYVYGLVSQSTNLYGQVVGRAYSVADEGPSSPQGAFLYSDGATKFLPPLDGFPYATAQMINNAGKIVGWSLAKPPATSCLATVWDGSTITSLPPLSGQPDSLASAVNTIGTVFGFSGNLSANEGHAVKWTGDTPTALGELAGFSNSLCIGGNTLGDAVGVSFNSFNSGGEPVGEATVWEGAIKTGILLSGWSHSEADLINDSGVVVGDAFNESWGNDASDGRAFIYINGHTYDLNKCTEGLGAWTIEEPSINSSGQIAASAFPNSGGYNPVPVLLTPVTPPKITAVTPNPVYTSSNAVKITLTGTNLSGASAAAWNGHALTSVSASSEIEATAEIPAAELATPAGGYLTITTPDGTSAKTITLKVIPAPLTHFFLSPTSVVGGDESAGVLQIVADAGPDGDTFSVSSSSAAVTVPSDVTIPKGTTGVQFAIKTSAVSAATHVVITADNGYGSKLTTTLTVTTAPISNFYVSPDSVTGGQNSDAVIQIAGKAGPEGDLVTITGGDSLITFPAEVTVLAGETAASFPIKTKAVSTTTLVTINAVLGSSVKSAVLKLTPAGRGDNIIGAWEAVTTSGPGFGDIGLLITSQTSTSATGTVLGYPMSGTISGNTLTFQVESSTLALQIGGTTMKGNINFSGTLVPLVFNLVSTTPQDPYTGVPTLTGKPSFIGRPGSYSLVVPWDRPMGPGWDFEISEGAVSFSGKGGNEAAATYNAQTHTKTVPIRSSENLQPGTATVTLESGQYKGGRADWTDPYGVSAWTTVSGVYTGSVTVP